MDVIVKKKNRFRDCKTEEDGMIKDFDHIRDYELGSGHLWVMASHRLWPSLCGFEVGWRSRSWVSSRLRTWEVRVLERASVCMVNSATNSASVGVETRLWVLHWMHWESFGVAIWCDGKSSRFEDGRSSSNSSSAFLYVTGHLIFLASVSSCVEVFEGLSCGKKTWFVLLDFRE